MTIIRLFLLIYRTMSTTITSLTSFQCSIYVFTTSLLLLLPCATIANNFQIYRSGYQGNLNDVFMTSEGVCNASSPSCHDYNANKITCDQCKCKDDKETFGYLDDSWRCFGGDAIRQNSGKVARQYRIHAITILAIFNLRSSGRLPKYYQHNIIIIIFIIISESISTPLSLPSPSPISTSSSQASST